MKKLFLVLIIFTLTGCWNYRELNQLAIATGFAIDIVDDEFEVTILISNSQKQGSSDGNSQASAAVYKGQGKTIFEAIKDASMGISKQIYVSHIEILVLSEDVAKEKTEDVIDFFFRYPQTRNEYLMIIAKDCKAGDTFKVTTQLETFPSQNISKNIEITDKLQGFIYEVSFNDFVTDLIEEGVNPVLPSISIVGNVQEGNKEENIQQNEASSYLKLGMMGIFKGFNFVGFSSRDQSKGINMINNHVQTTLIVSECQNGKAVVEINGLKTKPELDLSNDIPKIKLKVEAKGSISEVTCDLKIDEHESIKEISKLSEEKIVEFVNAGIDFAKENKTDIFGFGNMIYKEDFKYWYKIKDNWNDSIFEQVEFEIEAKIDIATKGSIDNKIEVK